MALSKMADERRGCDIGILAASTGYGNPRIPLKEVPMSATVSLAPLYRPPGWIVNKVPISSNGDEVCVLLQPDRRRKGFRCPCYNQQVGKKGD